jgi:DNA-binding transcriptional MocR family regulator
VDSRISARALSVALGGWRTREPAYEALADGIRLLCLDNRLAPRTTLPAERELAATLHLSRSTVAAAYRSLRESGHISSARGSGSTTLPLGRRDPGRVLSSEGHIDLQQASPAAWPGLAGVITEAATSSAGLIARSGYDVLGRRELRAAIAERYRSRGLKTTEDDILITTGAQSAIHLLSGLLVSRGDRVVIETPTYPHAADALRRAGARLVGLPVSVDEGWDLDRARQVFARTLPVLAYLMPDFQNPTGRSMSADERAEIAMAADRAGTLIVVDETTADLDIDRGPVPMGFDDEEAMSVVRVGSFGKTVWGGLRVGWIRAEADLIRRLVAARPAQDLGTPEFEQAVATALLPAFDRVLEQRSQLLREGRDAAITALGDRLPQWRVPTPGGGVSLWVELDAPLSSALVMDVRSRGLLLSAGPRFSVAGGHDRHLRIPFTAPPEDLTRGIGLLAESWRTVRDGAPVSLVDEFDAVV